MARDRSASPLSVGRRDAADSTGTAAEAPRLQIGFSRRSFLGLGAAAGAAWLFGGPRSLASATPAASQVAPAAPFLEEATLASLQSWMEEGELSSRLLTSLYLERIDALDRRGPTLRSVLEVNPAALEIAAELDAERRGSGPRGPLHGIPILLKDNIESADDMATSAGSLALAGNRPGRDSGVAERLRAAGAVILGKANLSEWANFRSNHSVSGWSARGGLVRNPYSLDRNACGSSSGSGAAVAANLCAAAVGTETNGSVVCPASTNGIVGLKPTVGLVSRRGIIPISHTQDTAGPMTRTVEDAAILLGAMAGGDPADPATREADARRLADYRTALEGGDLKGVRIGVARELSTFHPRVEALFTAALRSLRDAGATLVDPVEMPELGQARRHAFQVLLYEFKHDLEAYLATLGPGFPRTLAELIAFNREHRAEEMPHFDQELFERAQEKGGLDEPDYLEAKEAAHRLAGPEGIDRVLAEHRLTALVAPTGAPAWRSDLVSGDNFGGSSSSPAAISGYPNLTVPGGFVRGLPVGVSFFSGAWREGDLLRIGHAFERATGHRRPPRFLESVDPAVR